MDDAAGHLDRISALPDDVLQVILGFLPDAVAATRTAVLSRRWRRVWIHARALVLLDTKVKGGDVQGGFAAVVDWVFAQRGCAGIGSLDISMYHSCTSPERVNEWVRYAMQHVVESFLLEIPYRGLVPSRKCVDQPIIELPSHGSATSITMYLSGCRLRLPISGAAAKYQALAELNLSYVSFDEEPLGSWRTLGDFVSSSCCPRLRKLYIQCATGLRRLVLRAKELEEFCLFFALDLQTLDVTAPNLRVLKLHDCFAIALPNNVKDEARISALRLQDIEISHYAYHCRRLNLDIYDLTSVRRLSNLTLYMHGQYCGVMDAGIWLLENCPGVEDVDIQLHHYTWGTSVTIGDVVDLTLEGAKPFGNVRSMVVEFALSREPHIVASMSALLLRCPRLISLCIKITSARKDERIWSCFCDDYVSRSRKKNFLGYLGDVTISGFTGTDEEMEALFGTAGSAGLAGWSW